MVVPYIRNPRRLHNQQKVGIKTKSDQRLVPDHTNTYDTSTYKHVGRRTKAGGGGGYKFFSSNNSNRTGGEDTPVVFWIFWIITIVGFLCIAGAVLVWICAICEWLFEWCMCCGSENKEEHQQTEEDEDAPQEIKERKQLIRSKLHYEFVLSDRSNVNIESLRGEGGSKNDATRVSDDDNDDSDSVIVASKHIDTKPNTTSNSISSSSSSSVYMTAARNIRSNWRLRPRKNDDCSICQARFQPGQTICAAKNNYCIHIFHEKCMESWLMDHESCPSCQQNVIQW